MEINEQIIEQPEKEPSIEDDIRSAMASLKADKPEGPAATVEITPEIAPDPATEALAQRNRDDAGKFKKTEKPAVAAAQPGKERPILGLPATGAAPAAQAVKPPPGWNAPMREKFNTLPPEVQTYISQRDQEIERKITMQDEDRLLGKKVNEMATPYLPTIKAEGATVEKAFQDYLQTAHVLRAGTDFQKAQSVAAVMRQFRVSPLALISLLQGANVLPGNAPQQGMHNPVIDTLQQRLDRIEADRQAEVHQRQIQEQHGLQSQIDEFSSGTGHEHFERMKVHMGVLLENGLANDLDDAYEKAVYADPEIRSSLVTAQQQAEQDKRIAEAKARTDAARHAGGSVFGGPGSAKALNGSGANVPIEETIRAAIREQSGRI